MPIERLNKLLVPKLWGYEEWLVNTDKYCGKLLHIRHGYQCSLHYHKLKDETFIGFDGEVHLEYGDLDTKGKRQYVILRGDERNSVRIPAGTPHRFWAIDDKAGILEVSTTHSDDDVVRIEDACERKDPKRRAGFHMDESMQEKLSAAVGFAIGSEIEVVEPDEEDD
jgi:D-lyxose ketol-isomerase